MLRHLHTLAATSSTWTIDLAFVLKQLGLPFEFRSAHMGVNAELGALDFYAGFLDADGERVNGRLRELKGLSSPLFRTIEAATSIELLRDAVSDGSHLCVVLTDARRLADRSSASAWLSWASPGPDDWFSKMSEAGFRGHYVLLVAWRGLEDEAGPAESFAPPAAAAAAGATLAEPVSSGEDGLLGAHATLKSAPAAGGVTAPAGEAGFLDPGAPVARIRWLPARQFDAARLARGTDSDVILVPLEQAQREWVRGASTRNPTQ